MRPARVGPVAAGTHGVEQREVGAAGEVRVRRRALDQRPDLRAAPSRADAGIGRPSTSIVPDVASTRPSSIRTVVVLPDPLAPRKP